MRLFTILGSLLFSLIIPLSANAGKDVGNPLLPPPHGSTTSSENSDSESSDNEDESETFPELHSSQVQIALSTVQRHDTSPEVCTSNGVLVSRKFLCPD